MLRSFIASASMLVVFIGCGDDDGTTACVPGESVACVGAGGCSGGQSCLPDGSGFDSCECGSVDMGPPGDDMGTVDGGSPEDGGNEDGGEDVDGGPVECDPVEGSDCDTDEKCTFIVDGSGSGGETLCVADGSIPAGGDCVRESGGDECEAGTFCIGDKCESICDLTDDRCSDGTQCEEFPSLFGDRENVGLCQFTCDPLAQDCPIGAEACYLTVPEEGGSICGAPATDVAGEGEDCTFTNSCTPGEGCVVVNEAGTSLSCAYFCDPTGGGGPACDDAEGPGTGHGCISLDDLYADPVNDVAAATGVCMDCSRLAPGTLGCPS